MGVQLTQTQYKMPSDEICFEAPEINMASDIVLDARVSVVTVAKLVDVSVKGGFDRVLLLTGGERQCFVEAQHSDLCVLRDSDVSQFQAVVFRPFQGDGIDSAVVGPGVPHVGI